MIDATLSPASRTQLIVQKLKEANVLRSTTPSAQPQFIGGNYVPPIADMVKGAFNNIDSRLAENEAMAAFKLLDSQRNAAGDAFAKKYEGIKANDRDTLLKAAIEATTNPLLEDSEQGKLFATLLKPQSSLFGSVVPDFSTGNAYNKATNETTPIPEIKAEVDRRHAASEANTLADNEARRLQMEYAKNEDARKAALHDKEFQIQQNTIARQEAERAIKEQQANYEKFDTATKDLLPVYEAARQAQGILEQYPGEIPGYSALGNVKAKMGGVGMTPEEKRVRSNFDKLQELFQSYVTGAAAPEEQSRRIMGIIGRQTLDDPEVVRRVLPDLLKYLDAMNIAKRGLLGDPVMAEKILNERGNSLGRLLLPPQAEKDSTGNPVLPPDEAAAMEQHSQSATDIAGKLGVAPSKIRSIRKVP